MFIIKKYPMKSLQDKNLIKLSKDFLKKCKCCDNYPNCSHPLHQSGAGLLFEENLKHVLDETIFYIQEACKERIDQRFKNKKSHFEISLKSWVFLQEKNVENKSYTWHNHLQEENYEDQVSFIMYLTPTDLGTLYINDYGVKQLLIPETDHIFFWESKYLHSPDIGICNEERIVIAGSCCF